MPDCHALCADLTQAKEELMTRFDLCSEIMSEGLEFGNRDYELAVRFTSDFYEKNKDFLASMVKRFGRPALIEMLPERSFYWVMKWEFNFVDNQDKAAALSTDQVDIENAERYDIAYIDEKGEKKRPLILHCSPSGAIERCVYAILEKAYREQQSGKVPIMPLWLAPTQVRVIPVSDKFMDYSEKIADELEQNHIRADVDDRPLTLQKKVREAETEWINYVLVIGQKELESQDLPIRDRKARKIRKMNLEALISEVKEKTAGKPFQKLTLSKRLSKRPQF